MLAKVIIRDIMEKKGITVTWLKETLGYKRLALITDRLSAAKSANMSTDTLDEMLRVMGYKMMIVPENVKVHDGWYEVTDSDHSQLPEKRKQGRTPRKTAEDVPEKDE